MVVPGDGDYYLDELFDSLEEQEKLFTGPRGQHQEASRYVGEARRKQRARVKAITSKNHTRKIFLYGMNTICLVHQF